MKFHYMNEIDSILCLHPLAPYWIVSDDTVMHLATSEGENHIISIIYLFVFMFFSLNIFKIIHINVSKSTLIPG